MLPRPLFSFAGPWGYIIFTGVMFGSLGLATKYLTDRGVDPLICAAIPFSVAGIIALMRHFLQSGRAPWGEGLAMGAVSAAAPALMFNFGFSRLPASLVTLTLALGPVFTAITAHLAFRDDRFSRSKLTGLALSFGGVAVLAGLPGGGGQRSAMAFVVTLAGAALSGASLVWVRRMAVSHDPSNVLAPMMIGAAFVASVAAGFTGHPLWRSGAAGPELALLLAMGAGTVATYISSLKASRLAPASRVGLMGYLVPLVGVAGGIVLFNERFTVNLALGGILVLAGVALVGRANRRVAFVAPG